MLRLTKCKDNDKIIYRLIDSSSNEILACAAGKYYIGTGFTEQDIEEEMRTVDIMQTQGLVQYLVENLKLEAIDVVEDKKIQSLNKVAIIEEEFTKDK